MRYIKIKTIKEIVEPGSDGLFRANFRSELEAGLTAEDLREALRVGAYREVVDEIFNEVIFSWKGVNVAVLAGEFEWVSPLEILASES